MKLPRDLSGPELVKLLRTVGQEIMRQRVGTVRGFLTVGFGHSFEAAVNSNCELTVATGSEPAAFRSVEGRHHGRANT